MLALNLRVRDRADIDDRPFQIVAIVLGHELPQRLHHGYHVVQSCGTKARVLMKLEYWRVTRVESFANDLIHHRRSDRAKERRSAA
jgi:hypothetical protein